MISASRLTSTLNIKWGTISWIKRVLKKELTRSANGFFKATDVEGVITDLFPLISLCVYAVPGLQLYSTTQIKARISVCQPSALSRTDPTNPLYKLTLSLSDTLRTYSARIYFIDI